jgi:hypothetical protein
LGASVRKARDEDEDFILALNSACAPDVSELTREDLRQLMAWAFRTLVAETQGGPAGFLVLMRPGAAYSSDNYGWFERQFERHLYIDRLAVAESARGQGIGRALYQAADDLAREAGLERLTCEVNEDPPNPQSLAFHARLGFRFLKSRRSASGKTVAMFVREIAEA